MRLTGLTEADLREAKSEMVKWQNIRNENVIHLRDYLFTAEAIYANTDVVEEEEKDPENNDDLVSRCSSRQSNMSRVSRMSRASNTSKMTRSRTNKGRLKRQESTVTSDSKDTATLSTMNN